MSLSQKPKFRNPSFAFHPALTQKAADKFGNPLLTHYFCKRKICFLTLGATNGSLRGEHCEHFREREVAARATLQVAAYTETRD